jgi:methionine synthase II (cobalamin-independent)
MNILIPGQYPRSETLVQATRDFDRKRITAEELEKIQRQDAEDFMDVQEGYVYASTGNFSWQDLMRPFAEITNSKVTGLKRFYETNSFWKVLEFEDHPVIDEDKLDEWVKRYFLASGMYSADSALIFTLPFLYSFKRYSRNIDYKAVVAVMETVVKKLCSYPEKVLVFSEPLIGWQELTDEEREIGHEFLAKVHNYSVTPVILSTAFFNIGAEHDFLYSLPIDGIGVDFYANSIEEVMVDFPAEWFFVAGVLATDSTHVEEKDKLVSFFNSISEHVSKPQIMGTFAGPAELLPRAVADAKLANLEQAMEEVLR